MVVIVDNVTSKKEGGEEAVVKAAKGIERDIQELLRYHLVIPTRKRSSISKSLTAP